VVGRPTQRFSPPEVVEIELHDPPIFRTHPANPPLSERKLRHFYPPFSKSGLEITLRRFVYAVSTIVLQPILASNLPLSWCGRLRSRGARTEIV